MAYCACVWLIGVIEYIENLRKALFFVRRCAVAELFSAGICRTALSRRQPAHRPGGLGFTTQKIQLPRNMREVFIVYAGITGAEFSRVAGFPSVLLSTDTGQVWEFVIFSRKKFLKALEAHRIQSR